jgi:hypothetical protein
MFTTAQSGIWVGLLLTSFRELGWSTQESFDWASSAVKTYLGYLCFIFCQKWTRLFNERIVSSSNKIRSLATIRTAAIYIYFSILKCGSPVEPAALQVRIDNLPAHYAYKGSNNGWRVNLQLLKSYKDVNEHEELVIWLYGTCRFWSVKTFLDSNIPQIFPEMQA